MMQQLLKQRTEYVSQLQVAASQREEQLQGHYEQQQRAATTELRESLEAAEARVEELQAELRAVGSLHQQARALVRADLDQPLRARVSLTQS